MRVPPWYLHGVRRITVAGLACLTVGCVTAGCGSSSSSNGIASKSPTQIVQAAVATMKSAKSVHISGSIAKTGKTVGIDATIFSNGDIDGTVTENGAVVGVVKIGSTDYIRTTAAFYKAQGAPAPIAALMNGKWIELPDSSAGFGKQFTLSSLANSVQNGHGKVSAGTTSTVNGQPVVSVVDSKGGTLYVATTGPAYPLRVANSSPKAGIGVVNLTDWNQGKLPTPPPGARTPASFG